MINLSHNTGSTQTTMRYTASSFYGTGIPLQVLLHSFVDKSVVWFSLTYGDWKDNTIIIGVSPEVAKPINKNRHVTDPPMRKAFGSPRVFEEYELSDDVQKALSITFVSETSGYSAPKENTLYQIYIHDDHWSWIKPVDKIFLKEIVHCVLEQHSFYLGTDVDWSRVLQTITDKLSTSRSLVFKSKTARRCLTIRKEGIVFEVMSVFGILPCAVVIKDSTAAFSKSYFKYWK